MKNALRSALGLASQGDHPACAVALIDTVEHWDGGAFWRLGDDEAEVCRGPSAAPNRITGIILRAAAHRSRRTVEALLVERPHLVRIPSAGGFAVRVAEVVAQWGDRAQALAVAPRLHEATETRGDASWAGARVAGVHGRHEVLGVCLGLLFPQGEGEERLTQLSGSSRNCRFWSAEALLRIAAIAVAGRRGMGHAQRVLRGLVDA